MIVPMKKVSIIVEEKDKEKTIINLKDLGVLHPEYQNIPVSKDITNILDNLALVNQALEVLSGFEISEEYYDNHTKRKTYDWKEGALHVVDLSKRIDQLEEYSKTLLHKIEEWLPWGDFDPQQIQSLAKNNIQAKLYQIPVQEFKNLPRGMIIEKISLKSGIVNCLIIAKEKIEVPYKEVLLPQISLSGMRQRQLEDLKIIEALKSELHKHVCFRDNFLDTKNKLSEELEFKEVLSGMGEADTFSYVIGFVPHDLIGKLQAKARIEKWGILINQPTEEDNIPTLVRNPKWVSIIAPVFKIIEIVPGYRELDISLIFLVFFSIFFGIIIGDAGYGVTYALLTFLVQKKRGFKKSEQPIFFLFYILTSCAIIWGLLTGTIFGQAWLPNSIKPIIPALNEVKVMQSFCFFLGALHLSLAHSWRAILKFPSLTALVDIGWICILWTVFFLAKALILGYNYPVFANWLVMAGIVLVIFFTNPQKNILKAVGSGLGNIALSLMNNFTDVVSYVRLFAVGSAGVAVADTFNNMAFGIGTKNIFTIIVSVLILVCGHGLNLVLGPMSILVHGVRLNVLEFCSHADVKWSGFSYKPFK